MSLGQGLQEHRVLDRNLCIKEGDEFVFIYLELSAQLKIDRDSPVFYSVLGMAVFLIVINFCDRRSPVDYELVVSVLRDGSAADIIALGLLAFIKLKLNFGKIRRFKEFIDCLKSFSKRAALDIICVDIAVPDLDFGQSFHCGLDICVVETDIVADIVFIIYSFFIESRDL